MNIGKKLIQTIVGFVVMVIFCAGIATLAVWAGPFVSSLKEHLLVIVLVSVAAYIFYYVIVGSYQLGKVILERKK